MTDSSSQAQRRTLMIVFFTVFLDLMGFGLIIPIQPFFAESLGATAVQVTWLGAIFSLMTFLFAPVWGRLSDRVGRRPIILISIALSAVGYVIFGFARSLPILFFARLMSGIGSGNIGTAQAIIADSTTPEKRAKGMGIIGAAFGLGFLFGPALGGILGQWGLAVPALGAAVLCVANWASALFLLPETYPPGKHGQPGSAGHRGLSWNAVREAVRFPSVARIFWVYFLYTTAFSMIEQVLALFIERVWLADKAALGLAAKPAAAMTAEMLMLVGITAVVVQGGLIGRLSRLFGERRLLVTGTLLTAVSLCDVIFAGWAGRFGLVLANAVVMAAGTGLTNPSLSSLLSRAVDKTRQGSILGLGQSFAALGRVLGPAVSGALFQYSRDLPFALGAGLMLACTGVAFSLPRAQPAADTAPGGLAESLAH